MKNVGTVVNDVNVVADSSQHRRNLSSIMNLRWIIPKSTEKS